MGDTLSFAGDGELVITLRQKGKSSGHSCFGCCVSDKSTREIRKSSISSHYTAPLEHGQ